MKITIDTKEDTHSEIKKVIRLLKHLVGEDAHTNFDSSSFRDEEKPKNIFEDNSTPGVGGGLFGMFGDSASKPEPKTEQRSEPTTYSTREDSIYSTKEDSDYRNDSGYSIKESEETKDEDTKIEFYGF